jgi:hypothetical protein
MMQTGKSKKTSNCVIHHCQNHLESTRNYCTSLLKRLEMPSLPSEYIFLLIKLIINIPEYFQTNSTVQSVNIRNRPTANLSCFQKSAYYNGINLPSHIAQAKCGIQYNSLYFYFICIILLQTLSYVILKGAGAV